MNRSEIYSMRGGGNNQALKASSLKLAKQSNVF